MSTVNTRHGVAPGHANVQSELAKAALAKRLGSSGAPTSHASPSPPPAVTSTQPDSSSSVCVDDAVPTAGPSIVTVLPSLHTLLQTPEKTHGHVVIEAQQESAYAPTITVAQHNILPDLEGLLSAPNDQVAVLADECEHVESTWGALRPPTNSTSPDADASSPQTTPLPTIPVSSPNAPVVTPTLTAAEQAAMLPAKTVEQVAVASKALGALRRALDGDSAELPTAVDGDTASHNLTTEAKDSGSRTNPARSPERTVSAALESQFRSPKRRNAQRTATATQHKTKTKKPTLQLARSSDVTPPVAGPETDGPPSSPVEYDEGWMPRRKATSVACPAPAAPSEVTTFAQFSQTMRNVATGVTTGNPDLESEMQGLVSRTMRQSHAATRIQAKLHAFHATAAAHQAATSDLARCLADECDEYLIKDDNQTYTFFARQAVVFQEIATLQREMTAAVESEINRVHELLEDFAATKRAVRSYRAASARASSARDAFLCHKLQGKATLTGQTHESRGLAAVSARLAAEEAHITLLDVLGRAGTDNHVGMIDAVQSVASAVLGYATQVARVSIDDDRASLEHAAGNAALARHEFRQELQKVAAEISEIHRTDRQTLAAGKSAHVSEELIKKSKQIAQERAAAKADGSLPTFNDAFDTEQKTAEGTVAMTVADLVDATVRPATGTARRGIMFSRERVMGMTKWKPAYFECHGFTLRKIDGKGRRTVVAKDLRNARLDAAPVQSDGAREMRPFVFSLVTADRQRHLLQAQTAREFTEWFSALEKMIQGTPVGNHDFSLEVEISA